MSGADDFKPFKKFGACRAAVLHSHPQRLVLLVTL